MDKRWMEELRSKMDSHLEPAPKDLWADIEQQMIDMDIDAHNKRKIIAWRPWAIAAAIAATIVLVMVSIFKINIPSSSEGIEVVLAQEVNDIDSSRKDIDLMENNKDFIASTSTKAKPIQSSEHKRVNTNFHRQTQTDNKASGNAQNSTNTTSGADSSELYLTNEYGVLKEEGKTKEEEATSTNKKDELNDTNLNKQPKQRVLNEEKHYDDLFAHLASNNQKSKESYWSTNLYASNVPNNSNQQHAGYGSINQATFVGETEIKNNRWGETPLSDIMIFNSQKEKTTDIEHKQPVTAGISFSYNINDRWAIGTGISYSLLSSKLKSGTEDYFYRSKQTLHYLGIPIHASFTIWQNDHFRFYASAGVEVNKLVSGKLTTDYIVNDKKQADENQSISEKRLLWALNGAAGIQYKFSDYVGIYFEPSINYYFNNGSSIETIYKEHPFNLGLKIGLRISFQ